MPAKTIHVSDQQAKFIQNSVKKGRYRDASEVIGAGLRLLEQQERENRLKLKALQKAAAEGFGAIDRGEYVTIDPDGIDEFLDSVDVGPTSRRR